MASSSSSSSDDITPFPSPSHTHASLPTDTDLSSFTSSPRTSGPPSPSGSSTEDIKKRKKVNIKQLIEELPPPAEVPDSGTVFPPIQNRKEKKDVTEEERKKSSAAKSSANEHFKKSEMALAVDKYSQAIEFDPYDSTLFCNRAYARMKLEENGYAISDTTRAIELAPKYVKAYYRRALCHISIVHTEPALLDLRIVLGLDPSNKLAQTQLEAVTKLVRRQQFENAISRADEKSNITRCREIIVEGGCDIHDKSYAGPHLPVLHPPSTANNKSKQPIYTITEEFINEMREWFKAGKMIEKRYVWEIVLACCEVLEKEESLMDVSVPEGVVCDIVGDVHGQFYDFLHLLSLMGAPSERHCIIFNGDFVDRGSWSAEIIITLMAYKWLYPKHVILNRGNHETKDMNKVYGFEGEVKAKLGEKTYELFADAFTLLPLATTISPELPPTTVKLQGKPCILTPDGLKKFFVVHGGLFSKDGVTLDDIRKIDRFGRQPGQQGLMCELLWTDPQEAPGRGPSKRGVGLGFGPDVTRAWCTLNNITAIYRSHEVRQNGYSIEHEGLCTTVFSAPNYVDQGGNLGAYIRVDANGETSAVTFKAVEHPPLRAMAYANMNMFM